MNHTVFESNLLKKIESRLPGAAPGVMVQVYHQGRKICDIQAGSTFAYYDLASLTKIIFPVQALILAFQNEVWNLNSKVADFVPDFPHKDLKIAHCLNHSALFPTHQPFFQELIKYPSRPEKRKVLRQLLDHVPLVEDPENKSNYSNLSFLVLIPVLEKIFDKPLEEIWEEIKSLFFPRLSLEFSLDNHPKSDPKHYAPTEKCPWRGRVLQGEVHDENTWALGGISTHSGLFGSIDDVGWFGLFLRGQLLGVSKTAIKQKTAKLFATRSRPPGGGDWALGYMMPTEGASSAGDYFSPFSIGHTGFTGTSLWFDPLQDLLVTVLSNRVAFGREVQDFRKLRPQIHNWIVEGLRRGSS